MKQAPLWPDLSVPVETILPGDPIRECVSVSRGNDGLINVVMKLETHVSLTGEAASVSSVDQIAHIVMERVLFDLHTCVVPLVEEGLRAQGVKSY